MWRDSHLHVAEPYEFRRLRIVEQLAELEPGIDLTLPTDRGDDHEPAWGRGTLRALGRPHLSRTAPVPTAPVSLPGGMADGPRDPHDDHDLPPAA